MLTLTPTTQQGTNPKPLKSGNATFRIEFSEPVQNPTASLGGRNISLTVIANTDNKIWKGTLNIPSDGSLDGKEQKITISATDLAGNKLLQLSTQSSIDPATQLTRNASGNMQGTGGNDTRHRVDIDATPPQVDNTTPDDGEKDVHIDINEITVTLEDPPKNGYASGIDTGSLDPSRCRIRPSVKGTWRKQGNG